MDPAFISNGFRNWKKAVEKSDANKYSQCHKVALMTQETCPVDVQLSRECKTTTRRKSKKKSNENIQRCKVLRMTRAAI